MPLVRLRSMGAGDAAMELVDSAGVPRGQLVLRDDSRGNSMIEFRMWGEDQGRSPSLWLFVSEPYEDGGRAFSGSANLWVREGLLGSAGEVTIRVSEVASSITLDSRSSSEPGDQITLFAGSTRGGEILLHDEVGNSRLLSP